MKLKARRLVIPWPDTIPATGLRSWVLETIQIQADPLRWAITAVEQPADRSERHVVVEAVLIA